MFFNLDLVVESIRKLCVNTQCITCDKLITPCVRYPCGHSVCENCAEAGECLFCISANTSPVFDEPQTTRVNNTLHLLAAFQKTFKIDVEKRHRVSDYLKLEKQIFPECIQAPNKYANKRKSLNVLDIDKENNSPIYPGEKTTCVNVVKMKKIQYVQNWLNQNEDIPKNLSRKPFGDININTPIERKNVAKLSKTDTKLNLKRSPYRKVSHTKLSNNSLLLNKVKPLTKAQDTNSINKSSKEVEKFERNSIQYKSDRNESGIVLDDEPIEIEDIMIDSTIDKDKEAWFAVLEAARKDECNETQILSETNNEITTNLVDSSNKLYERNNTDSDKYVQNVAKVSKNVIFYKKSLLLETCKLCDTNYEINPNSYNDENNDVSIVINNSKFVTTINFMQCLDNKHKTLHKNSVDIQTDNSENNNFTIENTSQCKRKVRIDAEVIPSKIIKHNAAIQSLDVFDSDKAYEYTKEENVICNDDKRNNTFIDSPKHSRHLIVEDSDTDSITSHGIIHEVVAEVHTTKLSETVHPDVLTSLSTNHQKRSKRTLRGQTPNSSDSSDKENLDPNRIKHAKFGKKLKNKK